MDLAVDHHGRGNAERRGPAHVAARRRARDPPLRRRVAGADQHDHRPAAQCEAGCHTAPVMRSLPLLLVALVCAVALHSGTAQAIVPPQDCGTTTVKGKRYSIKADQIRCSTAKPHARRYLRTGRRPSGYRCKSYGSSTKLKFRCERGVKVFFAIKR
jgi:hypothetical protein